MASPPLQRLTKRSQFLFVRAGFRASRPTVLVEARRREAVGAIGLGLTASKKVGGAVERNRARRLLREGFRRLERAGSPGFDLVVVARAPLAHRGQAEVDREIRERLLRVQRRAVAAGESSSPPR